MFALFGRIYTPVAKRRIAREASTAVSVRQIFSPSEASANPAVRAARISSSVQPPSGPIASAAIEMPLADASASRIGIASRRSESKILQRAFRPLLPNAVSGPVSVPITGGRKRRACCADSTSIFSQRARRFPAAAKSALSVRAAPSGMISVAPNSVAFSRHHSNRSNFTSDMSNRISRDGAPDRNRLDQNELDATVAALGKRNALDPRQPDKLAVAQFVELPGLCAQHTAEMVRALSAKRSRLIVKFFDEESAPHEGILACERRAPPCSHCGP